jgi:hypothetical protein
VTKGFAREGFLEMVAPELTEDVAPMRIQHRRHLIRGDLLQLPEFDLAPVPNAQLREPCPIPASFLPTSHCHEKSRSRKWREPLPFFQLDK